MSYFDNQCFVAHLKTKRGKRSLRDVQEESGISPSTLSRLESGKIPDMTTFLKACDWLDVAPDEFVVNPIVKRDEVPTLIAIEILLRMDSSLSEDIVNAIMAIVTAAYK